MERTINNKVLLRALEPQERPSLPSNFAYTTMRRIRREQREQQRRQQVVAFLIVASVVVLGIGGLVYMFGRAIWQSLVEMSKRPDAIFLALPTLFCLTFFALLNRWLASHYVGRDKTLHT